MLEALPLSGTPPLEPPHPQDPAGTHPGHLLAKPHCPAQSECGKPPGLATLGSLSGHLQSPKAFQGADLIEGHRN